MTIATLDQAIDFTFPWDEARRTMRGLLRLLLFALLLLAAHSLPVNARTHGGVASGAPSSCPQAIDGGCAESPGGSFQVSNFYTGYTGIVYATRPNANMACIDYPCGAPAVAVPASGICAPTQDPFTASFGGAGVGTPGCGIIPAGCSRSLTGHPGINFGPTIDCSGVSFDFTVEGFNMGSVGGHEPTVIILENNITASNVAVKYNDFEQGGINYSNSSVNMINGSKENFLSYANTYNGAWIDSYSNVVTSTAYIGATTTGTGAGTNLTVTGTTGYIAAGDGISGTGVPSSTTIISQTSGTTGGDGIYVTSASTTAAANTITVSSPILRVSAVSSGTFARGQGIGGSGFNGGGQLLESQLTGTGGAACPDVTCTGTTGTYMISRNNSVPTAETVTGVFGGGGLGINTEGTVTSDYDYFHQINGRPSTGTVAGGSFGTPGDVNFNYYYWEGGCYNTGVHCELWEGVMSNGTTPVTWQNTNYQFGTCFLPSNTHVAQTTACYFISPGNVSGIQPGYTQTYVNTLINYTTDVTGTGIAQGEALAFVGGSIFQTLTQTNNFVDKTGADYYTLSGAGYSIGTTQQWVQLTGSIAPSPSVLTVAAITSGPIPLAAGMHITNVTSKQYIVAQLTGTGGAPCPDVTCNGTIGTYSLTGSVTVASTAISVVPDAIINLPISSGNFDLVSGAGIDSNLIYYNQAGGGGFLGTSPGYQ